MDPAQMNRLLEHMTSDEIRDGLWLIDVFERWGSMDQAEADEWRRRIVARQMNVSLQDALTGLT